MSGRAFAEVLFLHDYCENFSIGPGRFWPEPGSYLLNWLDSREFPLRKVKIQLLYNAGRFLKFIIREELCGEDTVVTILTDFV